MHPQARPRVLVSLALLLPGILAAVAGPPAAGSPAPQGRSAAAPPVTHLETLRLEQVTGGYDPDNPPLRHVNNTVPAGVQGVDLGANTDDGHGRQYFFFGDAVTGNNALPTGSDLVAYSDTRKADLENPLPWIGGLRLNAVKDASGLFRPFRIGTQVLGLNSTPTGAFSFEDRLYVFAFRGGSHGESILSSTGDPLHAYGYTYQFHISKWDVPRQNKFWQVAPLVIRNAEYPGALPAQDARAAEKGLIMFGQGDVALSPDGRWGVYLAWMPLYAGRVPNKADLWYWTPTGWTKDQALAIPLFYHPLFWTSLSVGRIPGTPFWVLVNQTNVSPQAPDPNQIVARIATTPWGLGSAPVVTLFNPTRDAAYGHFMHRFGRDLLNGLPPVIGQDEDGWAYGAHLINKYTDWNPSTRTATLYYLLSTWKPYQVQLMRTRVRIENGLSVSVEPAPVEGGDTATGRVTFTFPLPAAVTVRLSTSSAAVASVPPAVTLPAGALSATFPVITHPNSRDNSARVKALAGLAYGETLVTVRAGDAYEPDNIPDQAKQILPGQTQYRSLRAAADADWAWFQLDRDAVVDVFTWSGSATNVGDTELWIYAADGITQKGYNDDSARTHFAQIAGLALPAGRYYARVRSWNHASVIPAYALTFGVRPAAPSELAATAVSATEIGLSWTDNSTNEAGFRIERKPDAQEWQQIATVGANGVSYNDSTVAPETTYTYRVRSYNNSGTSEYASEATATTPAAVVYYQVSGTVTYYSIPLEGAEVHAAGQTVVTGADGTYSFRLPAGTVTVGISYSGPLGALVTGPPRMLDLQADVTGVDFFTHYN